MGRPIPQGQLGEIVREARSRTGVPAVAAGLLVDGSVELAADGDCTAETPFRSRRSRSGSPRRSAPPAGARRRDAAVALAHGRAAPEVAEPLPDLCQGLWSYANSGFWAAGDGVPPRPGCPSRTRCESASSNRSGSRRRRTRSRPAPPRATCRRRDRTSPAGIPTIRPRGFRPAASGRPSAMCCVSPSTSSTTVWRLRATAEALGAEYCLGCWRRELDGGRIAFDHEGSVAGFQSLLLIVPEERVALAVLTNSWRGSGRSVGWSGARARPARTTLRSSLEGRFGLEAYEVRSKDPACRSRRQTRSRANGATVRIASSRWAAPSTASQAARS